MSEGGIVMANQRSALDVTSRYNDFLFAPISDEPGGTRLSVLSALARINVDPWEEAARLATLSKPDAERTLVSTLNLFPDQRQMPAETEILAARLIALLPKTDEATSAKVATSVEDYTQRIMRWIVGLCFVIAIWFLPPLHHLTTTSARDSASTSNTSPSTEGGIAEPAPSNANSGTD